MFDPSRTPLVGKVVAVSTVSTLAALVLMSERDAGRALGFLVAVVLLTIVADAFRRGEVVAPVGPIRRFYNPIEFWGAIIVYGGTALFMAWMVLTFPVE